MKRVPNWRAVLRRAWSIRFTVLAVALSAVEFALPFVAPAQPSGWFAGFAALASVGAAISRIVAQPRSLP